MLLAWAGVHNARRLNALEPNFTLDFETRRTSAASSPGRISRISTSKAHTGRSKRSSTSSQRLVGDIADESGSDEDLRGLRIAPPLPLEVPRTAGKPPRLRPNLLELPLLPWELPGYDEAASEEVEASALSALQALARSQFSSAFDSGDEGRAQDEEEDAESDVETAAAAGEGGRGDVAKDGILRGVCGGKVKMGKHASLALGNAMFSSLKKDFNPAKVPPPRFKQRRASLAPQCAPLPLAVQGPAGSGHCSAAALRPLSYPLCL